MMLKRPPFISHLGSEWWTLGLRESRYSLPLLLLLLSRFSRVRLCATPYTAAHQAPPSLGLSRQEHWSGLPFPSPMHESEKLKWSCSVVSDPERPDRLQPTRLFRPWDFPGKSTGVGCHCLSEWLSSKRTKINAGDSVQKSEPLYTVGENVIRCSHCGSSMELSQKTKNRTTTQPSNSTPGYISGKKQKQ